MLDPPRPDPTIPEPTASGLRALSGLTPGQLEELAVTLGEKPYRGRQIFEHVYARGIGTIDALTVLPAAFRSRLADAGWAASSLEIDTVRQSADGTVKLALRAADDVVIESVLIGMEAGSWTQCLSSQAGCALDCAFCATGSLGFRRNLSAAEIVDQHLVARRAFSDRPVKNLVFMGMGEPLNNFENVAAAVRLLQEPRGCSVSPRRITISTAGVVPGIERMGREINALLAVSLNAPTQELREQLMPIARRWPLDQLMAALRALPFESRHRITIEYVLLAGMNDSLEDARQLVRLLSSLRCKVNVIPYNAQPDSRFRTPTEESISRFSEFLAGKSLTVTVRRSKGLDIEAACGQLAGKLQLERRG